MLSHIYHEEMQRQRRRDLCEQLRRPRLSAHRRPKRRLSRALGRSMIRIGSHLAADRARQEARSN